MYSYQPSAVQLISFSEQEIMDKAVKEDHPFRQLNKLIDLDKIARNYRKLYSKTGTPGIPIEKAIRMLIIQFYENYSDRQMEQALVENLAVKWFCGFELGVSTPDHSFFGKFRERLDTDNIKEIFDLINEKLEKKGLIGNIFYFADASGIITKTALWEERDKAIEDGNSKLNNDNVKNYAKDKDARWGAKGKDHFWFGHKRHLLADMRQGIIVKTAVTPANVPDARAFTDNDLCPDQGIVIDDKGYDTNDVQEEIRKKGCYSGTIQKNNRKTKNRDKDKFLSKLRMPFEGIFSKMPKRARYRGTNKVYFQVIAESIVHNLKRLIVVGELTSPIPI
mgnify:FL=1